MEWGVVLAVGSHIVSLHIVTCHYVVQASLELVVIFLPQLLEFWVLRYESPYATLVTVLYFHLP